jgi:hypothetical protein
MGIAIANIGIDKARRLHAASFASRVMHHSSAGMQRILGIQRRNRYR